jgi:hypothetical protein
MSILDMLDMYSTEDLRDNILERMGLGETPVIYPDDVNVNYECPFCGYLDSISLSEFEINTLDVVCTACEGEMIIEIEGE